MTNFMLTTVRSGRAILAGFLTVAVTTVLWLLAGSHVHATTCTQGCSGTSSGTCVGRPSHNCVGGCLGGSCSGTWRTYSGAATYGTVMGDEIISLPRVGCTTTGGCVIRTYTFVVCHVYASGDSTCGDPSLSSCNGCVEGPGTVNDAISCVASPCDEG